MAKPSQSSIPSLKLTLMGDGGVGKYMYADFQDEYEPTKADAYRKTITLGGDDVQIDILDTAGQEDYPVVRDGYIKHGDGFLLVFDLTNPKTLESVKSLRDNIMRVKAEAKYLPMILVGNKCDLTSNRKVQNEDAKHLADNWKIPYMELSAKTRENVDKAFSEIFVKIKQLNDERRQKNEPQSSNMTPKQYQEVRNHHKSERIKKKKRCILM